MKTKEPIFTYLLFVIVGLCPIAFLCALCISNGFRLPESILEIAIVGGGLIFGIIFLHAGMSPLCRYWRNIVIKKRLKDTGRKIMANIIGVIEEDRDEVNNKHGQRIICSFFDPNTKITLFFKSIAIWPDAVVLKNIKNGQLPVYLDQNEQRYYVDIDFVLSKICADKHRSYAQEDEMPDFSEVRDILQLMEEETEQQALWPWIVIACCITVLSVVLLLHRAMFWGVCFALFGILVFALNIKTLLLSKEEVKAVLIAIEKASKIAGKFDKLLRLRFRYKEKFYLYTVKNAEGYVINEAYLIKVRRKSTE